MQTRVLGTLLFALAIYVGITSCSHDPQVASAQPGGTLAQWEYKVFYMEALVPAPSVDPNYYEQAGVALADGYNKLGTEGWEYVGMWGSVHAVFKRPKQRERG